jgi:epoxyqueuosine reductase
VCPWNVKFAQALKVPELAPRSVLRDRTPRELAREILAMTQDEFSAAFKGSPMKRAKLRGLKRNAAVVLRNGPITEDGEDTEVLRRMLDDPEPLVREHARWALRRPRSTREETSPSE